MDKGSVAGVDLGGDLSKLRRPSSGSVSVVWVTVGRISMVLVLDGWRRKGLAATSSVVAEML